MLTKDKSSGKTVFIVLVFFLAVMVGIPLVVDSTGFKLDGIPANFGASLRTPPKPPPLVPALVNSLKDGGIIVRQQPVAKKK